VGEALEERLPPSAQALGPPLALALEPALVRTANTILARPRVQQLWEQSNRRAHQLLIALLEGEREVLVTTDGNVVLDLQPILAEVQERTGLGERLQERLPPDAGQLVIMEGDQLENARRAVNAIEVLSYFLSFLVLGLFALAVYLAVGRRRTMLLAVGISMLVVGLIVLVVRRLAGKYLVDALTSTEDAEAPVSAAWAISTELLRNVGFNVVVYGLLITFAAWVAGPSRPATWLRRSLAPTMRERPALVYGFVAFVLLVVLLTGPTDGQRIYPLLFVFALAFVGTEVLRRQTAREFPPAGP
jgi:predicted phage tail protein